MRSCRCRLLTLILVWNKALHAPATQAINRMNKRISIVIKAFQKRASSKKASTAGEQLHCLGSLPRTNAHGHVQVLESLCKQDVCIALTMALHKMAHRHVQYPNASALI